MAGVKQRSGGLRPGAGPKPKREKHAAAVASAEARIAARLVRRKDGLPTLIDRMLELADGVTVQETNKEGETLVYTRPPDRQACEYLINRILGKPTERQEVSAPGGGALRIVVEYEDPEGAVGDGTEGEGIEGRDDRRTADDPAAAAA